MLSFPNGLMKSLHFFTKVKLNISFICSKGTLFYSCVSGSQAMENMARPVGIKKIRRKKKLDRGKFNIYKLKK